MDYVFVFTAVIIRRLQFNSFPGCVCVMGWDFQLAVIEEATAISEFIKGKISLKIFTFLRYNITKSDRMFCNVRHWHSLSVCTLSYSASGSMLLSGGNESVFVQWRDDERDFFPRLGSVLTKISVSEDGLLYAISLQDNCKFARVAVIFRKKASVLLISILNDTTSLNKRLSECSHTVYLVTDVGNFMLIWITLWYKPAPVLVL